MGLKFPAVGEGEGVQPAAALRVRKQMALHVRAIMTGCRASYVCFCWQHWRPGRGEAKKYLPPMDGFSGLGGPAG